MLAIKLRLLCLIILMLAPGFQAVADEKEYTLQRLENEGWSISEPQSVEEIEAESLNQLKKLGDERDGIPLVPFGFQQKSWLSFKKLIKKDEKLYYISAPESDWDQLRGTAGYAIIRDGKVIYYFRTMVN